MTRFKGFNYVQLQKESATDVDPNIPVAEKLRAFAKLSSLQARRTPTSVFETCGDSSVVAEPRELYTLREISQAAFDHDFDGD